MNTPTEKEPSKAPTPEEAALGRDQYSPEYTASAEALDTQVSYAVGGRPPIVKPPAVVAAARVAARKESNAKFVLLGIVLLVAIAGGAMAFFMTKAARRPRAQSNLVSTTTDQSSANFDPTKPVPDNSAPAVDPKIKTAAYLTKLAATVNHDQKLPKMVEDYMQQQPTKATEGVFIYRYRMVKVLANEFDSDTFIANQKIAAAKTQCGTPADTGNLLQQGVTVRYTFVDKSNAEISSFDLTSDDCR